jgi:hypothetical protein
VQVSAKRIVDAVAPLALKHPLANTINFIVDAVGMLVRRNTLLDIPGSKTPWKLEGVCHALGGRGSNAYTYGIYPASYACLGGQAWGTAKVYSLDEVPFNNTSASWCLDNIDGSRFTHSLVYQRKIIAATQVRNQFQPQPRTGLVRNPNLMRLVNLTPQPVHFSQGVSALAQVAAQTATQPQTAVVVQAAYNGALARPLPRTLPATKSRPPRAGVKEKKGLARQIGVGVAKILDLTSESAEVVDAIYRALPKDVRKKWDRPERSADNIGQYGIGGADWKLQALYHNWHKVDVAKAIKNILVNELEDRIIGGAMAARNRATRPDRYGSNVKTEVRRRRRNRSR